jgi:hypothetical protein
MHQTVTSGSEPWSWCWRCVTSASRKPVVTVAGLKTGVGVWLLAGSGGGGVFSAFKFCIHRCVDQSQPVLGCQTLAVAQGAPT